MWKWIAENAVALAAFIVAFGSLAVQRRHYMLSAKPHLVVTADLDPFGGVLLAKVSNVGLGPALIKRFGIRINGRTHTPKNERDYDPYSSVLSDIPVIWRHGHMSGKSVLQAGEPFEFLKVTIPKDERMSDGTLISMDLIRDRLKQAYIEVEYQSAYGNKFEVNTKIVEPDW